MFTQNPPPKLLSIDEFIKLVPISRMTLTRLVKAGKLFPVKVGRRVFFRDEDVRAFIRSCSGE